jgi:hypothetical protein
LLSTNGHSGPISIMFFCGLALRKFTLVLPLGYITVTTAVTLPVYAFSIAFRSPLMVLVAVLMTLIGRGSVDNKLRPKGSSNLRCLSTCNPVSLYPISYSLSELLLELLQERFLCFFFAAFLSPFSQAKLIALRDAPIKMCNTAYGWSEEQKKRDVEHVY